MENEKLIRLSEAARRLHVSPQTIRAWIKRGILTEIQYPSRLRRVRESEIDRLLNPGGQNAS